MKRKLFLGLAGVIAMAVAAIMTVSGINASPQQSYLMSKDIEALTVCETYNQYDNAHCNENDGSWDCELDKWYQSENCLIHP